MKVKATGERRAVKYVNDSFRQIRKEVILLYYLNEGDVHSFVVKFHGLWKDQEKHYLVFDRMECNLHKWVRDLHPRGLNLSAFRVLAARMLGAFEYLGEKGVLHGDVKPNNFLLASVEDPGSLRVCDFGLSEKVPSVNDPMIYSQSMGVPSYRAPETMLECPTRYAMAGDVWGVGCVLLFALLGRHFFTTKATGSRDAMKNIIHQVCSTLGKPPGHMLDTAGDFEVLSTVIHAEGLPKKNIIHQVCGTLGKPPGHMLDTAGDFEVLSTVIHAESLPKTNSKPLLYFLMGKLRNRKGYSRLEVVEIYNFIK